MYRDYTDREITALIIYVCNAVWEFSKTGWVSNRTRESLRYYGIAFEYKKDIDVICFFECCGPFEKWLFYTGTKHNTLREPVGFKDEVREAFEKQHNYIRHFYTEDKNV